MAITMANNSDKSLCQQKIQTHAHEPTQPQMKTTYHRLQLQRLVSYWTKIKDKTIVAFILLCACVRFSNAWWPLVEQSFTQAVRQWSITILSFMRLLTFRPLTLTRRLHHHLPLEYYHLSALRNSFLLRLRAFSSLTSNINMKMRQFIGLLKCKVWLG